MPAASATTAEQADGGEGVPIWDTFGRASAPSRPCGRMPSCSLRGMGKRRARRPPRARPTGSARVRAAPRVGSAALRPLPLRSARQHCRGHGRHEETAVSDRSRKHRKGTGTRPRCRRSFRTPFADTRNDATQYHIGNDKLWIAMISACWLCRQITSERASTCPKYKGGLKCNNPVRLHLPAK